MNETFIPTEVKVIENSYAYLSGVGYEPPIALNIINYSLELQKINMQARMLAQQDAAQQIDVDGMIDKLATKVAAIIEAKRIEREDT